MIRHNNNIGLLILLISLMSFSAKIYIRRYASYDGATRHLILTYYYTVHAWFIDMLRGHLLYGVLRTTKYINYSKNYSRLRHAENFSPPHIYLPRLIDVTWRRQHVSQPGHAASLFRDMIISRCIYKNVMQFEVNFLFHRNFISSFS